MVVVAFDLVAFGGCWAKGGDSTVYHGLFIYIYTVQPRTGQTFIDLIPRFVCSCPLVLPVLLLSGEAKLKDDGTHGY